MDGLLVEAPFANMEGLLNYIIFSKLSNFFIN